jgi:ATP phosphoribosyltransferase
MPMGIIMDYITVALAKGRLSEYASNIFEKAGYDVSELREKSRKLIFCDEKNKVKFILVKATDVPCYVEYGAADIGIVGKDTILEEGRNLYEVLNLDFGNCKMSVCGPLEAKSKLDSSISTLKVATKYPHIAKDYFRNVKKQSCEIIKLNGSVELAPIVGLSDVIVDIVESGKTLEENGLCVLEDICTLSARLIVNRVSMKLSKNILDMIDRIKENI